MLTNPDRARKVLSIKIKIQISHSILNEIQNHKVQATLQSKIYKKHSMISWIIRIDFQPLIDDSVEFAVVWPCSVQTEAQWWWGRWLKARKQLNNAQIRCNLQLPYECAIFSSSNSAWILNDLPSVHSNNACKWWLVQETSKRNGENRWKKLRKIGENLRFLRFGSEIVKC